MIAFTSSMTIKTTKETKDLLDELKVLASKQVLVGVPEENNDRETQKGKRPIGNAALAYIHDNGAPRSGIPARPFMKPGISKAQSKINKEMRIAAKSFTEKRDLEGDQALNRAGMYAQLSIQNVINRGIGFAPLKRSTILGRLRRRRALWSYYHDRPWRKEEKEALLASFHPLVDTQSLLKSIVFVVQRKMPQ